MKIDRVDMELAAGRVWRAKEVLRGRLSNADYDCDLFGNYADVLHRMGDDDEAGRYYFLSARRDGIAGDLSRAFLARRSKWTALELWGGMPTAAAKLVDAGMPFVVRSELLSMAGGAAGLGELDAELKHRRLCARQKDRRKRPEPVSTRWHRAIETLIVLGMALVVVLGIVEAGRLLLLGVKGVVSFF